MKNIKAIFFDMDGLIFDTEMLRIGSCKYVGKDMNLEISDETILKTIALNSEDSKKIFIEGIGIDFNYDEFAQKRRDWVSNYVSENGMPIKKGLLELVSYLQSTKLKRAIVTSNRYERVQEFLTKANLVNSFDIIITGETVKRRKPYPDIYIHASKLLNLTPSECMVLEDSITGVQSACAAGTEVIMIPDIIQPNSELDELKYLKCDSLLDVIDIIEDMNK